MHWTKIAQFQGVWGFLLVSLEPEALVEKQRKRTKHEAVRLLVRLACRSALSPDRQQQVAHLVVMPTHVS